GREPGGNGLRLVGGSAVRLRERDAVAVGRRLPGLDDLAHHRLRGRVGDEVDRGCAGGRGRDERERDKGEDDPDPGQRGLLQSTLSTGFVDKTLHEQTSSVK